MGDRCQEEKVEVLYQALFLLSFGNYTLFQTMGLHRFSENDVLIFLGEEGGSHCVIQFPLIQRIDVVLLNWLIL